MPGRSTDADPDPSRAAVKLELVSHPETEPAVEVDLTVTVPQSLGLSSHDLPLAAAALMSLDDGVAVLDAESQLILSNLAWEEFVHAQTGLLVPEGGAAFLLHWERIGMQDQGLAALAAGLRSVLDGSRPVYARDIEVTDAGAQRWLQVKVSTLPQGGCTVTLTDVTQRRRTEEELVHNAMHDPLTGLANRALFTDRLTHALRRRPDRFPVSVALLLIDIDHFKAINDTFGHQAADSVLEAVAKRLRDSSRPGDTVARLGGDEFAMICDNISDSRLALRIAQRLLLTVNQPILMAHGEVDLSLSIGVSISDADNADARELIQQSDTALYRAKLAGRNRVELFDDALRQEVTERLTLEREMRLALEKNQFRLQYQPMVNLMTNRVAGAEALLRWDHPTRGMIQPAAFIRIAEESGLIQPLGSWVLETACAQAVTWETESSISVNVSGRQLQDPDFVTHVVDVLERTGLSPDRLCLEITESVLIEDGDKAAQRLGQLRRLGVHVALDDFGTGFSSLNYLHRFPVDVVKIDRSFVEGLGTDEDSRVIVSAIVSMTAALGVSVVAEGVETAVQLEQLIEIGSVLAQGFFFSRPLDADDIADSVRVA
jgi:diguanylate cyclase (GGDEF)-like protein